MTTFTNITYQDFKVSASILFQSIISLEYSLDQLANGEKALQLMYVGREGWSKLEENEAKTILHIVTENIIQVRMRYGRIE